MLEHFNHKRHHPQFSVEAFFRREIGSATPSPAALRAGIRRDPVGGRLGAGGVGYFWLKSSLPLSNGRLVLAGLDAEVSIVRDAHGIPTSPRQRARRRFALGFVHAQDRLYAMDLMRATAPGARRMVWRARGADRPLHPDIGLYRAAAAQYTLLSPELRQVFAPMPPGSMPIGQARCAAGGILSRRRDARAVDSPIHWSGARYGFSIDRKFVAAVARRLLQHLTPTI